MFHLWCMLLLNKKSQVDVGTPNRVGHVVVPKVQISIPNGEKVFLSFWEKDVPIQSLAGKNPAVLHFEALRCGRRLFRLFFLTFCSEFRTIRGKLFAQGLTFVQT